MHTRQRWACLDSDNRVIACGITQGKFDRICMNFTNLGFAHWIAGGQRYCKIEAFKGVSYGMYINKVSHGRIRRSKAKLAQAV